MSKYTITYPNIYRSILYIRQGQFIDDQTTLNTHLYVDDNKQ